MRLTSEQYRLSITKDPSPEIRCLVPKGLFWPSPRVVILACGWRAVLSCAPRAFAIRPDSCA